MQIVGAERLGRAPDKRALHAGARSTAVTSAASRERSSNVMAPVSSEQIERTDTFEIHQILDDVEYILAGEIGCRPRSDGCRHIKPPTSVFSSYDSHLVRFCIKRFNNMRSLCLCIMCITPRHPVKITPGENNRADQLRNAPDGILPAKH